MPDHISPEARSTVELASAAGTIEEFAAAYFNRVQRALTGIDLKELARLAEAIDAARRAGQTIFVAGNGGSATTASSMANDLGFDIIRKTGVTQPFRFLAMTDNNAVITAIANDVGYDEVFISQARIHHRPGDMLVVISASGNSPNVVAVAKWMKERGGTVAGLLGFTAGEVKAFCDIVVHVPTLAGEYGPVEDAHLMVNHVLAHWFQAKLRPT